MADRIVPLPGRAEKRIQQEGYSWFLEGENDEYVSSDAILVSIDELDAYRVASEACYAMYRTALDHVLKYNLWSKLGLPDGIVPLIKHDLSRDLPHICGRLDLSGGIEDIDVKLIEFNADTCTSLPESAYFQTWIQEPVRSEYKGQFNNILLQLKITFQELRTKNPDKLPTLLLCSLGYIEDQLNLRVIHDAAVSAGFEVDYANLEDVVFGDDGVFLKSDEGFVQYFFMYKLIPWEFIIFEEPELLTIITKLSIDHGLIVLNPSYSIAMQAKHMLSILHELFPDHPNILPAFDNEFSLSGTAYVTKSNFGRLGENIKILDENRKVLAETDGAYGKFSKVHQAYAFMYQDDDEDIYQAGMYMCNGKASCLSFRRRDALIIDDDAEFVSHVLF